jgi:hypothetical protein
MWTLANIVLSLVLLPTLLAAANDNKKTSFPAYVLNARTVLVLTDPEAGIAVDAPLVNKTAQDDVEKALMKWGRLTPVQDTQTADLIVLLRKGNGKVVQPTIRGIPTTIVL